MDVKAVLVEAGHATGRAGVVIDAEGDVWLTGFVERGWGTRLDDRRPRHQGLEGDRMVLGGRLPRGAVSVEALTDGGDRVACAVGDGAWVVVLDQRMEWHVSPVVVVFRDRAGGPVVAPLPADWPRVPVTDSDESCPACGASAWDVVTPNDGSRGWTGGGVPTPVIVCRVCGHEEAMGCVMHIESGQDEDPAVVQARIRDSEETRKLSHQMMLSAVTFPIYGAEGHPGRISGSGGSGDRVSSVTVAHGSPDPAQGPSLCVTTALEEHRHAGEVALAQQALARWLDDGLAGWTGGSDAAFVLKLRADERGRERSAAGAITSLREIVLDDAPLLFTCVQAASRWAAVARTDSLIITVTGSGIDSGAIRLHSVPDPAKTLI